MWPIAFLPPDARRFEALWGLAAHAAATLYLTAAYFGRRGRAVVASSTLAVGGLVLIISSLASGRLMALSSLEFWWLAVAVDLLPVNAGLLASVALRAFAVSSTAGVPPPDLGS
jgi:hypothetical protein